MISSMASCLVKRETARFAQDREQRAAWFALILLSHRFVLSVLMRIAPRLTAPQPGNAGTDGRHAGQTTSTQCDLPASDCGARLRDPESPLCTSCGCLHCFMADSRRCIQSYGEPSCQCADCRRIVASLNVIHVPETLAALHTPKACKKSIPCCQLNESAVTTI